MTNGMTLNHAENAATALDVGTEADIRLTDDDMGDRVATLTVQLIDGDPVETISGTGFSGTSHYLTYEGSRDILTAEVSR